MKRADSARPVALARILVIDDEVDMLANYKRLLSGAGYECLTATDASRLMNLLVEFQPDLVLTDLVMPNGSGLDVLERVHGYNKQIPVIIVTGHGSIETAVEAMKLCAVDFVTKPFSVQDLRDKIGSALKRRAIENLAVSTNATSEVDTEWRRDIVGIGPNITRVLNLVRKVARTDVNVLITGESGTGKELVARAIHRLSSRRNEIFVPMDCASLPESLLESELFGYRKGAFTGANADKMGLFEFAHKGTLFLDEIAELQPSLQSKLLRVLQERCFRPIGGRKEIEVDIRVLAATNRDLEEAVQIKTFRSDLFYRLNVVVIHLPSLRENTEDIALLANHFLRQFNESNQSPVQGVSPSAMVALKVHRWPGNVRELQNVIKRAMTLAAGPLIELHDLSDGLQSALVKSPVLADSAPPANEGPHGVTAAAPLFQARTELVGKFERDFLVSLLLEHDFNIVRAAAASGCHRRTLYRMILRHNIDLETLRAQRKGGASHLRRGATATVPEQK